MYSFQYSLSFTSFILEQRLQSWTTAVVHALVHSLFVNGQFRRISRTFQNLFIVFRQKRMQLFHSSLLLYDEMNVYQYKCHLSYCFRYSVQLILELEANLLDQNFSELEFELARIQMKRPLGLIQKTSHTMDSEKLEIRKTKMVTCQNVKKVLEKPKI